MTVKELLDVVNANSRALGYRMWKESYLIAWAVMDSKSYPRKPEKASPELYPKPKSIPMPENLIKKLRR